MSKENVKEKAANARSVRFSDAPWYSPGLTLLVGGAGGIGSWLCLLLARQEAVLFVYDMDTIDETNMGGQLYGTGNIGDNKAQATRNMAWSFAGNPNVHVEGEYTAEAGMANPIMISAFDNMSARKIMFEKWAAQETRELFIDGRMLAEGGQIFLVQKGMEDRYREELFDDSEVEDQPCSMKATSHSGAIIAGLMVTGLNNYITNTKMKMDIRDVPFKTTYELPLLMFETTS